MAKYSNDIILDTALNFVTGSATKVVVCDGEPATYTAATTATGSGGNALGSGSLSGANFTVADGDVSGRKWTLETQTGLPVNNSGTADHVAIVDDSNSRLLVITTVTAQAVSAGGTMDVSAFDQELEDPA